MMLVMIFLALAGLLLSIYAVVVVERTKRSPHYVPWCDLSSNVSCTVAFTSTYGRLLFLSNAWYGVMFYGALVTALFLHNDPAVFALVIAGAVATGVLAVLSYGVQKNFCVICSLIYAINVGLLVTYVLL